MAPGELLWLQKLSCLRLLILEITLLLVGWVWLSRGGLLVAPVFLRMAFLMKSMLSNQVKNLGLGGGGEESKEESTPSDPAAAAGMTREEYEEYQKQMVEEKMERDAAFAQKKAERACLRVHLREKYRLPKSELDENQIQMAGDDVGLPEDLQKMVAEDQIEEEDKDSILGQLQNIQNMDMDAIKEKAQATFTEIKQAAEQKCSVM